MPIFFKSFLMMHLNEFKYVDNGKTTERIILQQKGEKKEVENQFKWRKTEYTLHKYKNHQQIKREENIPNK